MSKKRTGSEYWIVTRFSFHEHDSADAANTEADRLRGLFPDKTFRVIRCKRNQKASPDKIAMGRQLMALQPVLDSARAFLGGLDGSDKAIAVLLADLRAAVEKASA